MIDLKRMVRGKRAMGMEIELSGDRVCWRSMLLRLRGEDVVQVESYSADRPVFEIVNIARVPVILIITGKNVIFKKVRLADEYTMLSQVIPVSRQEDFVYRVYLSEEGFAWVVCARKSDVEYLLDLVRSAGCFVEEVMLGIFPLETILPLIQVSGECVYAGEYAVYVREGRFAEVKHEVRESDYVLKGDEHVSSLYLPAYVAALSFFFGHDFGVLKKYFPLRKANGYVYHRKYGLLLSASVVMVLGVLSVNYGIYRNKHDQLEKYRHQIGMNRELFVKLDSLKEKREEYGSYISGKGLDKRSHFAFYGDRIAGVVPDGIRLLCLEMNAPKEKIRDGESVVYRERSILIKGTTSSGLEVDLFMKRLREESWVERIVYHDYSVGEQKGVFTIEMEFNGR